MSGPLTPLSQPDASSLNPEKIRQILETALLTAQEPLPISELRKLFKLELSTTIFSKFLEEIQVEWSNRSGAGYRSQWLALPEQA